MNAQYTMYSFCFFSGVVINLLAISNQSHRRVMFVPWFQITLDLSKICTLIIV